MTSLWHKILADLWLYKSQTGLAIISIAAGVFCVGTLFGMIDLQLAGMDAAHRASQPSHVNLILRNDADRALLPQIATHPEVAAVDTMTPLTVRFRLQGQAEWAMGTLIVRPDYSAQTLDRTTLLAGSWPDGEHLAVERLSATAAGIEVGDSVEFATTDGFRSLPIGGVVRHPFVKPPNFGGQLHFFAVSRNLAGLDVSDQTFRQLLITVKPPYSAEKAGTVARDIRLLLARHQVGVNATLLQDPNQHWGRPIFAGINRILQIMALASMVLASALITNTLSAHVTHQTDQIGVMKALGGHTWTIVRLYLTETLIMALLAIVLAVPLGLLAAYLASCKLLGLFNIDCTGFTFSIRALAFMLIGGIAAPLLAALGPVLRGSAMTVRVAIARYGLGSDFGSRRFDRWVERFGEHFLPTLYAAALSNLFRRRGRFWLTQGVLIAAGVTFLVLMSLIASVNLTLDNELARTRYAVRLGLVGVQNQSTVERLLQTMPATQKVEFWQRLPLELSKEGAPVRQKGSLGVQMLALPAATRMYRPLIVSGRWLDALDAGHRVLVLSAETAELNNIAVGSKIAVRIGDVDSDWQVIGLYRWLAGSNYTVEPVYGPRETVQALTGRRDLVSFAVLDAPINTLAEEYGYVESLKRAFQANAIPLDAYTTQAKLEQRRFARNQFNPVIATLSGLAAMIAAVGGIGLSGVLTIGVLQRIREIGVLRSVGAPGGAIFRLFILEGLFHGCIAWMISVPLAYVAAEPIAAELGLIMFGIRLDVAFDFVAIGVWLAIVVVLSLAAAYWPARKAARLTVRECLGH